MWSDSLYLCFENITVTGTLSQETEGRPNGLMKLRTARSQFENMQQLQDETLYLLGIVGIVQGRRAGQKDGGRRPTSRAFKLSFSTRTGRLRLHRAPTSFGRPGVPMPVRREDSGVLSDYGK